MVHLDGIERAVLGAVSTVHAHIGIDIELRRVGDRPAGVGVGRAHDPNALGWAHLGADPARGAAVFDLAVIFFINQEGYEAELFWNWEFLFGVLYSKYTFDILATAVSNPFSSVIALTPTANIVQIGIHEVPESQP